MIAGTPFASAPAGTSWVTTAPAPVVESSPSSTGATSTVFDPVWARADLGAVLGAAVVVGGDRARADVGAGSDLRIAHVGEVRHLGALAHVGVLHLHERPDVGAGRDLGTRAQRHERADGDVVTEHRAERHRLADHRVAAHDGVDELRVGTDHGTGADHRAALEDRARQEPHVGGQLDGGVDVGAGGIDHRDARLHPSLVDTRAERGLGRRELGPVVHTERFVGIVHLDSQHRVPGVAEHTDHIGEVVLALRVLGAQPAQRRREEPAPEAVDRGVHLVDLQLRVGRVGLLDDPLDIPRSRRARCARSRWDRRRAR